MKNASLVLKMKDETSTLPSLDRERGSYGLKEFVLATSLVDALGMSRESPDAIRLFNWHKGGPKTGSNANNFPLISDLLVDVRSCFQPSVQHL